VQRGAFAGQQHQSEREESEVIKIRHGRRV
jgi:hypothetical protein